MSVPKLEVSDIQATVLRPRPSPYKGEYVILRINEAAQGREFFRRIIQYTGIAVNIIPQRGLTRPAVTTTVMCDHAEAFLHEE